MAEPAFALCELLKLVVALGVTIGLFYALALFMKRLQVGTGRSSALITVLAALPLGGKEKLWVVDVAGEKLVIGTSPGNVNCLHVLKNDSSSLPRVPESSVAEPFAHAAESSRTNPSSLRQPESSLVESSGVEPTLDPGLRRGEGEARSSAGRGFADLLEQFRSWQK